MWKQHTVSKMEQIPFKIVITGTIRAYNQDHAHDLIKEMMKEASFQLNAHDETIVVQCGDNVKPVYVNLCIWDSEIQPALNKHYCWFIREILKDLEETIPKPPLFFDKMDYLKTRDTILERINSWKKMDDNWPSDASSKINRIVEQTAKELHDKYYRKAAENIIAAVHVEEENH